MTFIYVSLKVVNFSLVFTCRGFVELVGDGVCYMDVGYWDMFIVDIPLQLLVGCDFMPKIPTQHNTPQHKTTTTKTHTHTHHTIKN